MELNFITFFSTRLNAKKMVTRYRMKILRIEL